ncbi:MAG: AMP-binding protein [Azoarcus sp.]|nr:AMP-binding protein [Azoarcus sp.]
MSEPDLRLLSRHWALPADNGRPIAWCGGQPIARARFYRDIEAARRTLAGLDPGELDGRPGVALYDTHAYRFAVWLLAAWSLGLAVVLPGDDLPATREALPIPWIGSAQTGEALSDWSGGGPPSALDHGRPAMFVFTSGSTGKPSLIGKELSQLRAEVEMFERAFGADLTPETRFVTSVPHQHMYGLPFFMLWSLSAPHPFWVEKLRYPEDLGRLPPADYLLVSAPTFLKHLPDAPPPPLGVRWKMATSAGSSLALDVARAGIAYMNAPLYEIYGSTETGAAAHRVADAPWQPMPGVRLALEEGTSRLLIHSPLLSEAERESGFLSGDIARLGERGLELIGRADRVVKIGEKRISLTRIEQELSRLPEVASARVLPLPHEHESDRLLLGAVVVLSPEGRALRATKKKAHFDLGLRARLRDRLDPLALPRRWRYVEAFPCNDMGKTTRQDMERLFAPRLAHAEVLPRSDGDNDDSVVLQLAVPHNLAWFEGHFPGLPILPGVVQVDWAAHFARLYFSFDASVCDIASLKFQHIIRPGDAPCLKLSLRCGGKEIEFTFFRDDKIYSHGVFVARKSRIETEAGT